MNETTTNRPSRPVYRVTRVLTWLVYAFAVASILFLATAFFLRLFDANTSAPFVRWVYRATRILMEPFRGIFPAVKGESGSVFDASLLFAMFMYGLLALGMHALLDWIDRRLATPREVYAAGWYAAPAQPPAAARTDAPELYVRVPEAQGGEAVSPQRRPPEPAR